MNIATKQRIVIACLGSVLSASTAYVAGGLTGWAFHVYQRGMSTPEMFGWTGLFIIVGYIALLAVTPSLLTILLCGVVWRTPLARHALLSVIVPLFLGGIAIAMFLLPDPDITLSRLIVTGASCLTITVLAEVLMRSRLQNTSGA